MPVQFRCLFSIEDKLFGKNITFTGKTVELWKKEKTYNELIKTVTTDRLANAYISFELISGTYLETSSSSSGTPIPPPVIFLKIFDEDELIPYIFEINELEEITLQEGENNLVVIVDLADRYVGVTNEEVVCTAVLLGLEQLSLAGTSSSSSSSSSGLGELEIPPLTGRPYPEITVKTSIVKQNTEPGEDDMVRELGETVTNRLGYFIFSFVKDKLLAALFQKASFSLLKFKFEFFKFGQSLGEPYIKPLSQIPELGKRLFVIKTSLTIPSGIVSVSIENLQTQVEISISPELQDFLSSPPAPLAPFVTLRNIRAVGGLKRVAPPELLDTDLETIELLDAHAQLETVSKDFKVNDHIISKGYTAVYKIAIAPRSVFARDVVSYGVVSDFEALKIFKVAEAHHKLYSTIHAEILVKNKYAINQ